MSDLLPLFPLPNVVLFPNVFLPLHIFEPRYREMIADALKSDRLIAMVLLQPKWEGSYEGRPPVYPIGCSGVITHVERLDDGRYNIVLRGVERVRIVREVHTRRYRRAQVESLMQALGERMGELGKQQEALSHEADVRVRQLLDQALRDGKAQPSPAPR